MPIVVQLDFRIIVFIKNEEKMTNDETFQGALWIRVDSPTSKALVEIWRPGSCSLDIKEAVNTNHSIA